MICVDTNILFHGIRERSPLHEQARHFLSGFLKNSNFVIAELVLAELYQLIRNPALMGQELSAREAMDYVQRLRTNPHWKVVENAPVMAEVW